MRCGATSTTRCLIWIPIEYRSPRSGRTCSVCGRIVNEASVSRFRPRSALRLPRNQRDSYIDAGIWVKRMFTWVRGIAEWNAASGSRAYSFFWNIAMLSGDLEVGYLVWIGDRLLRKERENGRVIRIIRFMINLHENFFLSRRND